MIFVGIDVAKDKHDCFITNSDGEVLFQSFTIANNLFGFDDLYQKVVSVMENVSKVKVGLEATGHYSYNLLGYLFDKGFPTYIINPLHTNLYRKSLSLRQTKTDKVDARTIASMLMSDVNLKSYSDTSYHNEELKSLTRYRFDKVKERSALKVSISRLVCILFPELEKLVPVLHCSSVYSMLYEFPGAKQVAAAHLTRLSNLLDKASKGHYKKDTAITFREAARNSIGSNMPAKSLELKHTIRLIRELDSEIDEIENEIKVIMDRISSPILSIPGISYRMGAMIIAEIGDFTRLIHLIRFLPRLVYLYLPINPVKWITLMPGWKNAVQNIYDMHCLMQRFMCVPGILRSRHILPRKDPKENTIMLQFHMQPKNLSE